MAVQFMVDEERCEHCGECVRDCVVGIIEQDGDSLPFIRPENEEDCMRCQHCLAICPHGAVSVLGKHPELSTPLVPGAMPSLEQAECYTRGRRTVRQYRGDNVERALLDRILAALGNVPTGVNAQELTFTVIDDRNAMQRLREKVYEALAAASDEGRLEGRYAGLQRAPKAYRDRGKDLVFRGAPHALIVTAPPSAPCGQEDVVLALAYFELLAQSAGLGTVWWGLLKSTLAVLPELKPLFGIPDDALYYAMLFGAPTVHYARTAQRDDGAVVRRLEVAGP